MYLYSFRHILIITVFFILFFSCSEKNSNTPESVIYANAKYMTEENLTAVMETIHPESPVYDNTEKLVKEIFKRFDLNYKIEHLELLEENNEEALIKFVQITTKLTNAEFNNSKFTGVHTLRKDGNLWKIYSTKSDNIELLN